MTGGRCRIERKVDIFLDVKPRFSCMYICMYNDVCKEDKRRDPAARVNSKYIQQYVFTLTSVRTRTRTYLYALCFVLGLQQ